MEFIGNLVIDDVGIVALSMCPNASQLVVFEATNARTCHLG